MAAQKHLESPGRRRLQTSAVMKYMFIFLVLPFLSLAILGYILCFTCMWWTMVLYLGWLWYDWGVDSRGSRPQQWYRRLFLWKAMAEYFPNEVIVSEELPADRNYIFGWHPHGIITVSAFTNFCTNGTGLDEKMPGIRRYMASLSSQFYYPFRREVVSALGVISASKQSLAAILGRPTGGHGVGLVIGGAEEAMESHPGNYSLNLANRKGFVKVALRHGASLVPVYTFGETEVFHQLNNDKGTALRAFQSLFKKKVGVSPVLFHGAGMRHGTVGMLPFRKRMTTVSKFTGSENLCASVGQPIHIEKVAEPTQKQIDDLHMKYVGKLYELFETYKHLHGISSDEHLCVY